MSQDSERQAVLAAEMAVYGQNTTLGSTSTATGLVIDSQSQLDSAHRLRVLGSEFAANRVAGTIGSTGGQLVSTTAAAVSLAQNPDSRLLTSTFSWNIG